MKFPEINAQFFTDLEKIPVPRYSEVIKDAFLKPRQTFQDVAETIRAHISSRNNGTEVTTQQTGQLIIPLSILLIGFAILGGVQGIIFLIFVLAGLLNSLAINRISRVYRSYAAGHGLSYAKSAPIHPSGIHGVIFSIGHTKQISHYFASNEKDTNRLELFTYTFTTGHGKSSRRHTYNVVRFEIGKELPHILLDNTDKFFEGSSIPTYLNKKYRVELEGDFNNYFHLYTANPKPAEALTILTPDVMQTVKDDGHTYDIEFVARSLVVSMPVKPTKTRSPLGSYDDLLSIAKKIIKSAESNIKHYKFDTSALMGQSSMPEGHLTINPAVILLLLIATAYIVGLYLGVI